MELSNSDFSFIEPAKVRQQLKVDVGDMAGCLEIGAYKASIVLAGSFTESLLFYALDRNHVLDRKASEFWQLADQAQLHGVLAPATRAACDAIRLYRNMIHPDKRSKTGPLASRETAILATNLASFVLNEVADYSVRNQPGPSLIRRYLVDQSNLYLLTTELDSLGPTQLRGLYISVWNEVVEPRGSSEALRVAAERYRSYKPLWDSIYSRMASDNRRVLMSSLMDRLRMHPAAIILGWHSCDCALLTEGQREGIARALLRAIEVLDLTDCAMDQVVDTAMGHFANILSAGVSQEVVDGIAIPFCRAYVARGTQDRKLGPGMTDVLNRLLALRPGRAALSAAIASDRSPDSGTGVLLQNLRVLIDKAAGFAYARPGFI